MHAKKRRKVSHISLKLAYVSKLMQPLPRSQYHSFHQYLKWLYVVQKPIYQFILTWRQLDWKEHVTSHKWLFWQRKKNSNRMCFRSYQYARRHKKLPKWKTVPLRQRRKRTFHFCSCGQLTDFFLEQFGKKLILFGHNIQSFDCPVLMHALQACNKVSEFTEVVDGFVDTLKLFNFVKPGLSSYRQENLCECLSGIVYTAHNAIGDVSALKTLVQSYFTSIELDKPDIQRCSVTVQSVIASYLYSFQIRLNLPSLQPLVARKITSQGIARKIAGSGLQYTHLQTAFNHNQNGISNLCVGNNVEAQCELQNQTKIISSLNNQLAQCNES